jgi:hypothetical protein
MLKMNKTGAEDAGTLNDSRRLEFYGLPDGAVGCWYDDLSSMSQMPVNYVALRLSINRPMAVGLRVLDGAVCSSASGGANAGEELSRRLARTRARKEDALASDGTGPSHLTASAVSPSPPLPFLDCTLVSFCVRVSS